MLYQEKLLKYFDEQKEFTDTKIKSGIELYRKGDFCITVTDSAGNPIRDAVVEVAQASHEFKFGANIFMLDGFDDAEKNQNYREEFAKTFNLATIPFYWNTLEPEEGKIRFEKDSPYIYRRPSIELCMEYCRENGIEPKCHCLNYDNFAPDWAKKLTVQEYKEKLERRFAQLAERYSSKIPSWEVLNEVFWPYSQTHSPFYFEDDYAEWSFQTAERYFHNNHLIINDFAYWSVTETNTRNQYYLVIEKLLREGCHIDSIGLQLHGFHQKNEIEILAQKQYNPERLYAMLDLFAKFGKKLQLTEMTVPAYSDSEEAQEIQAQVLKNVYSILFSHPAMEAIIYWNLPDGYAAFAPQGDMTKGENMYYGGLLNYDITPKRSILMLRDLIHKKWNTKKTVAAPDGTAMFRGFYGDYDVTVTAAGKTRTVRQSFSARMQNGFNKKTITV